MLSQLGLQKTTLVDFPGHVAATLFTHGCPLRCPYCHNPELVSGPVPKHFLSREEISRFLTSRARLIDGVCITGGEPLVHQDLGDLIQEIRSHGLAVKLDTSGMFPEHLERLLDDGLIDFIAIDFKTGPEHYDRVGGDGGKLLRAIAVARAHDTPYELRTTAAPGVVTAEDVAAIAAELRTGERYVLTQFQPGVTLDPLQAETIPYTSQTLLDWCETIRASGAECILRGA